MCPPQALTLPFSLFFLRTPWIRRVSKRVSTRPGASLAGPHLHSVHTYSESTLEREASDIGQPRQTHGDGPRQSLESLSQRQRGSNMRSQRDRQGEHLTSRRAGSNETRPGIPVSFPNRYTEPGRRRAHPSKSQRLKWPHPFWVWNPQTDRELVRMKKHSAFHHK